MTDKLTNDELAIRVELCRDGAGSVPIRMADLGNLYKELLDLRATVAKLPRFADTMAPITFRENFWITDDDGTPVGVGIVGCEWDGDHFELTVRDADWDDYMVHEEDCYSTREAAEAAAEEPGND